MSTGEERRVLRTGTDGNFNDADFIAEMQAMVKIGLASDRFQYVELPVADVKRLVGMIELQTSLDSERSEEP